MVISLLDWTRNKFVEFMKCAGLILVKGRWIAMLVRSPRYRPWRHEHASGRKKSRGAKYRPRTNNVGFVEALERRQMLSGTTTLVVSSNTDTNNSSLWTNGLPNATTAAIIDNTSTGSVTISNNISSLLVPYIEISGSGNVTLAGNDIAVSGDGTSANSAIIVDSTASSAEISANLTFNAATDVAVNGSSSLTFAGNIGGTAFQASGTGTLTLSGTNTISTGSFGFSSGTSIIAGAGAIPIGGSMIIGSGTPGSEAPMIASFTRNAPELAGSPPVDAANVLLATGSSTASAEDLGLGNSSSTVGANSIIAGIRTYSSALTGPNFESSTGSMSTAAT
jgi:hypothetical protein